MMPSLMMMTSTRAGVTTIRLSIDKGKIFLSLTFFHHFLILYILYCLQLQCYKNSVCLVLCLALQLQLIEFSKGGAAMHDSVVLDLCTCWDRIFQHFSNISQSCVDWVLSIKLASGWLSQAQLSWHEDNNNIKPLSLFITEKLLLNLDVHMIGSLASLFTSLTKPF